MRTFNKLIGQLQKVIENRAEKNTILIERWFIDPETGEGDLNSMEKTLFSCHTSGQPIPFL